MFAVIETGGKQYKVNEGDVLYIEKLEVNEGDKVTFDKVLAVSGNEGFVVGAPYVGGATVVANVVKKGEEEREEENRSQTALYQGSDRQDQRLSIMTKIVFYKSGGVFYGFEEHGHTGYGDSGSDVLCSAISAMTMLIINAIEVAYASDVDYIIDEDTADIKLIASGALLEDDEKKRYAISGLITAYFYQLNDLVEDYYDYLEVEEREMPIESAKI